MLRRPFFICVAAALTGLALSAGLRAQAPSASPIVAVFVVDGLRPDSIDPAVTPTLWRLQHEGVWYPESHAAFPTVTRVNGASLATGAYPSRHGLVGNTMYVPDADPAPFSAGEWRNLTKLAEASPDKRLLTAPTLAERLTLRGRSFVAVSSGSTGSGFVLNPEAPRGVASLLIGGLEPATLAAFPKPLNDLVFAKFGAAPTTEGRARLDWTERVVREHVLPEMKPDVLIDWLTEPDSAQHTYGVSSPEGKAGLANADRNLGLFLDTAKTLGLLDRLHVIVTSDHGFARHGEAVSLTSALIGAGLKQSKTSDDVVIASNSQALAIHVKQRDPARIDAIARFLLSQPWIDLVFTAAAPGQDPIVRGRAPGTFAIDVVRGNHATRAADLLATLRWSSEPNGFGVRGTQTIASDSQSGVLTGAASGHGGLSPYTVRNTLILWGPRIRRATSIRTPAAIVDIAPTVTALLGLADERGFDGRVLREALVDGPDPEQVATWRQTFTVSTAGYEGAIQISGVETSWYVDKGYRVR
jgi:arylsulfatase A-like enzyme